MDDNQFTKYTIGKPELWLINAAGAMGIDVSALEHEVSNYFINHSISRHGIEKTEEERGQLPITDQDIASIPVIVKAPNYTVIGMKRKNESLIAYAKHFKCCTTIYLEEVLDSRKNKALRSKTMYKKMGLITQEIFIKILSNNAHTDISNIKIVVGAGGNPGGEAV
ncbi:hypothetical protein FACS1894137_06730 [Spirochaetia bacterium]|nr:hypothetical protein FACS1894137_06730 [Spirochaetia bacterium]